MEFATGFGWARLPVLAAGFMLASVLAAPAQIVPADEPAEVEAAPAPDAGDADILEGVDIDALDWSQLNIGASTLADSLAAKKRAADSALNGGGVKWSSNAEPNGVSSVAVKRSLSPFWDTRIGADMTVAREPTTMSELLAEKAGNGGTLPQSSGSAWARATAPGAGSIWDKTALEARIDPGQDQSRLGTSLTKSVPLSSGYSLTLQNGYNVIEQGSTPVPGLAGHSTRNYETEQSAKLSVGDTGASLVAGQSLSTADDKWLRRFGAEQKLFDHVTLSGSIGETAQGTTDKSLKAGFKQSW